MWHCGNEASLGELLAVAVAEELAAGKVTELVTRSGSAVPLRVVAIAVMEAADTSAIIQNRVSKAAYRSVKRAVCANCSAQSLKGM